MAILGEDCELGEVGLYEVDNEEDQKLEKEENKKIRKYLKLEKEAEESIDTDL